MTHNWKPGDVATIVLDGTLYIAVRGHAAWRDRWFIGGPARGSQHGWTDDQIDDSACRLPMIDPEDRETAKRLASAMVNAPSSVEVDDMQAALRSLLEPEPEEPTGLGALARSESHEPSESSEWLRLGDGTWIGAHRLGNQRAAAPRAWSDLPRPITVLSEGWQETIDD